MKTSRCAGMTVGALALTLVCASGAVAAVDPDFRDDGRRNVVLVCHRTSSSVRPYVLLRVRTDSPEFTRHLVHRHYANRSGSRDLIDRMDGRIRSLRDCPEWWNTELDWPFEGGHHQQHHNKQKQQEKQDEGQTQNIRIYLYNKKHGRKGKHGYGYGYGRHGNKYGNQHFKTYTPRQVRPGSRPTRANQVAPRGIRPKGIVRAN